MTKTEQGSVRLLASVTSVEEACLAATHGADVIDAKNPNDGALGALPHETVAAIRRAVPGHIPISATVGDLAAEPEPVLAAARAMAATGCDIVKIGLFPGADTQGTIHHLGRHLAERTPLVAVLLADLPLDLSLVPALGEAGFAGVMLDTGLKDGRTLLDHRSMAELADFVDAARSQRLMVGLAGSLKLSQISALLAIAPDVLGFRGALCAGAIRTDALEPNALRAVRSAIPTASSSALWRKEDLALEATS